MLIKHNFKKMDRSKNITNVQSLTRGVRGKKGLIGIDLVMNNLNRKLALIKDRSMLGLIEASIIIRDDMENTPPLIPFDLGNLRASWFTTQRHGGGMLGSFKGKKAAEYAMMRKNTIMEMKAAAKAGEKQVKGPVLIMGFAVNYAAPVHEMMGVNFKKSGSGAKFFQSAIMRNSRKILKIIADPIIIK